MREFFGRYGSFLQLWQTYELMLEVMIMRTLRLSEVDRAKPVSRGFKGTEPTFGNDSFGSKAAVQPVIV
jgi:hypothetical protein